VSQACRAAGREGGEEFGGEAGRGLQVSESLLSAGQGH